MANSFMAWLLLIMDESLIIPNFAQKFGYEAGM